MGRLAPAPDPAPAITTGQRRRVRHLAEPGNDVALCGARRGKTSAPSEADLCIVCGDMARSARWGR
jgi:hypothetical protein